MVVFITYLFGMSLDKLITRHFSLILVKKHKFPYKTFNSQHKINYHLIIV